MKTIQSKSTKRLIVECIINNKPANFLIDTGASIGLIDNNQRKKFNLTKGRKFNGTLVGAGGKFDTSYVCNDIFKLGNKIINQFVLADIEDIVDSIKRETGITILGIIGLPQMKFAGIQIDANDDCIILE